VNKGVFNDLSKKVKGVAINAALKLMAKKDRLAQMFFSTMASNIADVIILPASYTVWKTVHGRLKKPEKHGLIESGKLAGIQVTCIKTGVGTPSVANVMQVLKEIKPRAIIRIDYAGALVEDMPVGSVFVAKDAIPGDGTCAQYINEERSRFTEILQEPGEPVETPEVDPVYSWLARQGITGKVACNLSLLELASNRAKAKGLTMFAGTIWSTDGLFTESKDKVAFWKSRGAIGVDMETSLIYLLGAAWNIPAIAIHGISDNLATDKKPFFELDHYDPALETGIEKSVDLVESFLPDIH
jgi:uridine phosphorylase